MRLLLIIFLLFITVNLFSQTGNKGVHFEDELSWKEILAKAQKDNKMIFVDLYTSWCSPCRIMEQYVFPLENVGDFMNSHFISYKLQMDSAYNPHYKEDEVINFGKNYNIKSFPTYLYFSPQGEVVHKFIGSMNDSAFIKLGNTALNPELQYFTLRERYKKGEIEVPKLWKLAIDAKYAGDDSLSKVLQRKYLLYTNSLPIESLATVGNVNFIETFWQVLSPNDRLFKLMYTSPEKVNIISGEKQFAENRVFYIIYRTEIGDKIWPHNKLIDRNPDWAVLTSQIKDKYNQELADRIVLRGQVKWFKDKGDKENYARCYISWLEKFGLDTTFKGKQDLNDFAFSVLFEHINDKGLINRGIAILAPLVEKETDFPEFIDTYANLLYKVGRNNEAISIEERAMSINASKVGQDKRTPDSVFDETVKKMRTGEPTWPLNR